MQCDIYYNGTIITMEEALPVVEAIAVKAGVITAVGSREEVMAQANSDARLIDLQGRTMLPGFIDGHSHIISYASMLGLVQLQGATDFQTVKQQMQQFIADKAIDTEQWVCGFGYDHNFWPEKCHPNREMLDSISVEHPILLTHQSGHMCVVRTRALQVLGLDGQAGAGRAGTDAAYIGRRGLTCGGAAGAGIRRGYADISTLQWRCC